MSYILDALKKAESERERGAVPGLSSGQANHSTFIHYRSDQKPWWLVAVVLGLLLALVVALWAWRQSAPGLLTSPAAASSVASEPLAVPSPTPAAAHQPGTEAKAAAASVQKPELPVRAPLSAPVPAAVTVKASSLEVAASTVAHVQAKVVPPQANLPPVSAKLPVALPVSSVPPPPAAAAPTEPTSKPAPSAAPIRSASGGVPMLSELPEPMRRQIPALNISGAVYSDAPPEWTLIINDQLMGKGSQVAPEVRLEEISGSSAVFNFKGQRFRIDR